MARGEKPRQDEKETVQLAIQRCTPMISATVLEMVGYNEEWRDEVLSRWQEEMLRSISTFRGDSDICTWACTIARRCATKYIKERVQSRAGRAAFCMEKRSSDLLIRATPIMLRPDAKEKLQQIDESLSEEDRQLVTLRDIEGLHFEEIAGIMEKPAGTLRVRHHRIREKVARALGIELVPLEKKSKEKMRKK